jgi:hypothetical protein
MNFLANLFRKGSMAGPKGVLTVADQQQIEERWKKIEELAGIGKPSTLREAVIEADKLVNLALDRLYPGREKAAERLVEAKEVFGNYRQDYENLWYAHKIRNEMVHTVGFELPSMEAKNILDYFRKGLEVLGVLRGKLI